MARRSRAFFSSLLLSLGLYATVVLASPSLHHDFDCHMKSPRHCQACVANPLAPRADSTSHDGTLALVEIGATSSVPIALAPMPVAPRISGRAPPQ